MTGKHIFSLFVGSFLLAFMVLPASAEPHSHLGQTVNSVAPTELYPGEDISVSFDYTIWHHHSCYPEDTRWWVYLDSTLLVTGTNEHPACGERITFSVDQAVTVPDAVTLGDHTLRIVSSADNSQAPWWTKSAYLPIRIKLPGVSVDIDPDTLNLGSKGQTVTAYIDLPDGYNEAEIAIESVSMEGMPCLKGELQDDGTLMVKFGRLEVQEHCQSFGDEPTEMELKVRGMVNGILFDASDLVNLIW